MIPSGGTWLTPGKRSSTSSHKRCSEGPAEALKDAKLVSRTPLFHTPATGSFLLRSLLMLFLSESFLRFTDALVRFVDIEPTLDGSPFAFKVFVLLEEVLDFLFEVIVDIA